MGILQQAVGISLLSATRTDDDHIWVLIKMRFSSKTELTDVCCRVAVHIL